MELNYLIEVLRVGTTDPSFFFLFFCQQLWLCLDFVKRQRCRENRHFAFYFRTERGWKKVNRDWPLKTARKRLANPDFVQHILAEICVSDWEEEALPGLAFQQCMKTFIHLSRVYWNEFLLLWNSYVYETIFQTASAPTLHLHTQCLLRIISLAKKKHLLVIALLETFSVLKFSVGTAAGSVATP